MKVEKMDEPLNDREKWAHMMIEELKKEYMKRCEPYFKILREEQAHKMPRYLLVKEDGDESLRHHHP